MKFEIVTKGQFMTDIRKVHIFVDQWAKEECYENLKLPKRATSGSAGYDFYLPVNIKVYPGDTLLIPTGIKAELDKSKVLEIYPRSSLGFKYRMKICNTVGIIDADYYNNENNEGHIMIKIENCGDSPIELAAGSAFAQGIIKEYFLVDDDEPIEKVRKGGMGSTSK